MRLKEKELMIFVRFVPFFLSLYHHLLILDLAFTENVILIANPSKSGGDWWFGRNVVSGKSGLFPKTYIEIVKPGALFDYLYPGLLFWRSRKLRTAAHVFVLLFLFLPSCRNVLLPLLLSLIYRVSSILIFTSLQ